MEIEKVMCVAAPAARVWDMLLDPQVMGGCVPGMKSIEVLSELEYVALIHVKISFISARFKLRTTIVEQRAPHYLRCEGTGEDAAVASSLRQQSEIFLAELPDGQTELRMKVRVDVLGRLGSFGLSVMKTKADRMWDEFGQNLVARLSGEAPAALAPEAARIETPAAPATPTPGAPPPAGWWTRLWRGQPGGRLDGQHIRVELRRGDTLLVVHWPRQDAQACASWLRDCLPQQA